MMIAKAKGRKQTLNNATINQQWWQLQQQQQWQGNGEAMVMATMARGSSTSTSHQQAQQSVLSATAIAML